jgi:hypothetical protein
LGGQLTALDQVAEGYRAMDERRAIKTCCDHKAFETKGKEMKLPLMMIMSHMTGEPLRALTITIATGTHREEPYAA